MRNSAIVAFALLACTSTSVLSASAQNAAPPVGMVEKAPIFPGKGKEADWKKAIAIYSNGLQSGNSGSLDQAIEALQQAIKVYPYEPVFYNGLAVEYYQRHQPGDFLLAEKALHSALLLQPHSAMLYDNLAKGLFEQKKYVQARSAMVSALKCNPQAPKAKELKDNIAILDKLIAQQKSGAAK